MKMMKMSVRRFWPGLLSFLTMPFVAQGQNAFKVVGEDQTWTSSLGNSSEYVAAQAVLRGNRPVIMTGNFDLEVLFPGGDVLIAPGGVGSIFAGVLEYDGTDWEVSAVDKLEPANLSTVASPTSEVRDLAVVSNAQYYVTGLIDDGHFFRRQVGADLFLSTFDPMTPQRGFLARGGNGVFNAAYYTDLTMQPRAVTTDPDGNFLVVGGQERGGPPLFNGADALLHRYSLPLPAAGVPLPAPVVVSGGDLNTLNLSDVVVTTEGDVWAGGTNGRIVADNIWLGEADFVLNQIGTTLRAGSEGADRLFKMEHGPEGEVLVAFTVSGRDVSFGALTYDLDTEPSPAATGSSTHAFLAMIKNDNTAAWLTPLGISREVGSVLVPQDLSVDGAGNIFVTFSGAGRFEIEGVERVLDDAGQIVVNGSGRVLDYTETPFVDDPQTGAAVTLENRLVLGSSGVQSSLASIESRELSQTSHQISWVDPDLPGNTIASLAALVTAAGGQVHLESNYPTLGIEAVSVWLTRTQLLALQLNPDVILLTDPLVIETDAGEVGETPAPDWGLLRIFDPYLPNVNGTDASYFYPSGFVQEGDADVDLVRVYVIDRGLEVDENFELNDFEGIPGKPLPVAYRGEQNIAVDALVQNKENADYDPDSSSDHPRQLINLLASVPLGSAAGTAMEIVGVDIYTGADDQSGSTYLSYLLEGINAARLDALDNHPGVPALIVIASSGVEGKGALSLNNAIMQTLSDGIPIILSAGNDGNLKVPGQVGNYVPAKHGEHPGVITVGATALGPFNKGGTLDVLNPISSQTNHDDGSIISLYAPGENVETGHGAASGTSFSCALVAGLATTYMARHPDATAAQVEQALVQISARYFHEQKGREVQLARSACAYEGWLYRRGLGHLVGESNPLSEDDADDDGLTNFEEFLGGSHPLDAGSKQRLEVSLDVSEEGILLTTNLPLAMIQPDGTLHDGCWSGLLRSSPNLVDWQPGEFELILGTATKGRREVTFDLMVPEPHAGKCFFQFVFSTL